MEAVFKLSKLDLSLLKDLKVELLNKFSLEKLQVKTKNVSSCDCSGSCKGSCSDRCGGCGGSSCKGFLMM